MILAYLPWTPPWFLWLLYPYQVLGSHLWDARVLPSLFRRSSRIVPCYLNSFCLGEQGLFGATRDCRRTWFIASPSWYWNLVLFILRALHYHPILSNVILRIVSASVFLIIWYMATATYWAGFGLDLPLTAATPQLPTIKPDRLGQFAFR